MFVISVNGKYVDVTLMKRFRDCSDISKELFIKYLKEDIEEAIESFNEVAIPRQIKYLTAYHENYMNEKRNSRIQNAKAYAENKWRTEKYRNAYVNKVIEEINSEIDNYVPKVSKITYFDFDGNCGTVMGIPGAATLSLDKLCDEAIARCYEALEESRFFRDAIGWEIRYNGFETTYAPTGRPEIKLIFNAENTAKVKEARDAFTKSVCEFYGR